MRTRYFVGLDIGTHSIKVAVGEARKKETPLLLRLFKLPSSGLRRGAIIDAVDATEKLSSVFAELKKISPHAIDHLWISIATPESKMQSSIGVVAVSRADYEIFKDDIDRAVQSAHAVNLPLNRTLLHALVKEYVVDGVRNIQDPLGMYGNRLEVVSVLIDDFAPAVKSFMRSVEMLGGGIGGILYSPLASSRSILTKRQKELGVVLIDIGFGKTGISVYEEHKLLHSSVIPMGAGNITSDLAISFKLPIILAETLKLSYGSAYSTEVGSREAIDLQKLDRTLKGNISRRLMAQVIEARVEEIFEKVGAELAAIGKSHRLPGGAVLAGGGAKLPGIVELAKETLKLPVHIGVPDASRFEAARPDLLLQAEDPEYAGALGLLAHAFEEKGIHGSRFSIGMPLGFKRWLRFFVP